MKIRQYLLLWSVLLIAVCLYSLPERQSWTFDKDMLSQISVTRWMADYREKKADQIMDWEKLQAGIRRNSGRWGTDESQIVWEPYMPMEDPERGLNLPWGTYELTVTAKPGTEVSGSVVCTGYQSFIENGDFSGTESLETRFVLTDTAFQLQVAFDKGRSGIEEIRIRKVRGFLSPDVVALGALAGLIGTMVLWFMQRTGPTAGTDRRDALVVLFIAIFSSMPLLWQGLYEGHDLLFHLNRIEGIASGLRCGQFPVRIHASTLIGYGYAASEFYPELFLYLPAVIRNLGVSLSVCVQIFLGLLNLVTAVTCYFCVRRLLRDRGMALGATALYVVNPYRLVNLYTRATLGESLAMIFFPVLILAMRELLTGDDRKWPLLSAAMLGIFMSHLLSTLFSTLFCGLAVILLFPRVWQEKRRILHGLLAAGLTALCVLWFVVPMMMYAGDAISTYVGFESWIHALTPGGLLVGFAGGTGSVAEELEDFSYSIGVIPGYALMVGAALSLIWLSMGEDIREVSQTAPERRLVRFCLIFSGIALFISTNLFPWKTLCTAYRFSVLFHQIQFPWRFVGVATPFMALAGAWGYLGIPRYRTAGMVMLSLLCLISGGYVMQHVVEVGPVLGTEDISNTRQDQFEYLYPYTEKEALEAGCLEVRGLTPYTISGYKKRGTTITFRLAIEPGEYLIEAPLLYYPGYVATDTAGNDYEVDRGQNNVLRVHYSATGEETGISIRFMEPRIWRVCELVSLMSVVALFILYRRRVRWK